MKKICVIGLGSIGRRHIRNIKRINNDVRIDILRHDNGYIYRNTGSSDTKKESDSEYGSIVYSYDALDEKYDAVFITNPTTMHIDTLHRMTEKSDVFFIEKPLRPMRYNNGSDRTYISDDKNESIINDLPIDKIYYVACPMRYTNIIRYIKENINLSDAYCLRAMSSSYLPEWRPGTDYTKCYSARRELGGGVAADLIHEWDYISHLVGMPDRVHAVEKKLSNLDINVEDIAVYIGEYIDKIVEVHLDYFGRKPMRNLQIFMPEETIECDFIKNGIRFLRSGRTIELPEDRDDYQIAELKHFFDIAEGRSNNDSNIYDADKLLRLLET